MSQYTANANYIIYFSGIIEYNLAIAAAGGNGYIKCPHQAAIDFGLNWPPLDFVDDPTRGIFSVSYSLDEPGDDIPHPLASGVLLSPSVDSVIVPGQAGNPASVYPAGPDMELRWYGNIILIPDVSVLSGRSVRKFLTGFEFGNTPAEQFSNSTSGWGSRASSRTMEGIGLNIRGNNGGTTMTAQINTTAWGASASPISAEIFYYRLRVKGNAAVGIWRTHGGVNSALGCALKQETNGTIGMYSISATGVENLIASTISVILPNIWYKILTAIRYPVTSSPPEPCSGSVTIVGGGVTESLAASTANSSVQNHASSEIGKWTGSDTKVEYDIDDWICAETLDAADLIIDSHIQRVFATGLGPNDVWAPSNPFSANQMLGRTQIAGTSEMTNSVASARLELLTDYKKNQDAIGMVFGGLSMILAIRSISADGSDGSLGWNYAGVQSLMTSINELNTVSDNGAAFRPLISSGFANDYEPLYIQKDHSNTTGLNTVRALQNEVEKTGLWNYATRLTTLIEAQFVAMLHNCMYPSSAYAFIGPIPDAQVSVKGGTYVGNGTQQTVSLPTLCHWLWIRAVTGATSGVKWMACNIQGHKGITDNMIPNYPIRVFLDDSDGVCKFTVSGSDTEVNANGVTYQYIAFCDPGSRFSFFSAYAHAAVNAPFAEGLTDANFQIEAAFVCKDLLDTSSNTSFLAFKGPGHLGTTGLTIDGTPLSNFGSFPSPGIFSIASDIIYNFPGQASFGAFRTSDGSGSVVVQLTTYIGDGTASRVIPLTPVSQQAPLFVIVMPQNAVARFRDPSHTGTQSSAVNAVSTNIATGITATGTDQITVGITLNANGVGYSVFAFPGGNGSNGTYYPPNDIADGDQWPEPPYDPPQGLTIITDGGLVLGGAAPFLLLKNISGIYTLIKNKTNDTLLDRQPGQDEIDVKIPDPTAKGGYVGG